MGKFFKKSEQVNLIKNKAFKKDSKECEICKNVFFRVEKNSKADFEKKRFCSRACANKGRILYVVTETVSCKLCIKDFSYKVKKISPLKKSHCHECSLLSRQFRKKKKDMPFLTFGQFSKNYLPKKDTPKLLEKTKKELFSCRKNWQSARSCIQSHAVKILILAGQNKECFVCGYSKHVEACHINPVSGFSDESTIIEINAPSNLIGLCPNHHGEFDDGVLSERYLEKIYAYAKSQ